MGMTENFWEHRSFKEQGLDIIPQIHLGEKASALERAGIHTMKGDINRDIIERNSIIQKAIDAYEKTKEALEEIKAVPVKAVTAIKNEILDMISKVAERNNNRLNLPIIGAKYVRQISDRTEFQKKDVLEDFVEKKGFTSFEDLKSFKTENEQKYKEITSKRTELNDRISYLEDLLRIYEKYEPYIKYNKEYWSLKGFARKNYERMHKVDLITYKVLREELKERIREPEKKIYAGAWRKELDKLIEIKEEMKNPYAEVVTNLASCEVLEHNRKELTRMIENERNNNMKKRSKNELTL